MGIRKVKVVPGKWMFFTFCLCAWCALVFFAAPSPSSAGTLISADSLPWSGYWWPSANGGLATGFDYREHPSPIEKYLLLTTGVSSGPLKDWYLNRYYDPDAVSWSGLCPYWARASMLENYDILPSSENNMIVRVGDKKGLLTLCHDFGNLAQSSGDDPVDFHYWLFEYIQDQGQPFLADLSAGEEVWYYPIYGFEMSSSTSGRTQSVKTAILFAADNVSPDYIGTLELTRSYTYDLYYNDQGEITGGSWTGKSVNNHPDALAYPLSTSAKCPYLDCDEVRRLAKSKDDFLEKAGNAPQPIDPGTYNLVLLDADQYILAGKPGDTVYLEIKQDDTSDEAMEIRIFDNFGESVFSQSLAYEGETACVIDMQNPPYSLTLTQNNYTRDPNIYSLSVKKFSAYHQNVPYIPKNGAWSGFVLLNSGDTKVDDVALVTSDAAGGPVQTVFGPVSLNPGEKQILMLDDLPYRPLEYGQIDSVMMISNQPVTLLNLFGIDKKPMAGFVQGKAGGSHLVIPDTVPGDLFVRKMKAAVFNESFAEANLLIRVYAGDGQFQYEVSEVLSPGARYAITPGVSPFYHVPDGGWMDVVETGGNPLSAYIYLQNSTGNLDSIDTLFAMPMDDQQISGQTRLVVPRITPPAGWWITRLTLINPNDAVNPVTLHVKRAGDDQSDDTQVQFDPHEKQVIDLTDLYGMNDSAAGSVLEISGQYPITGYYSYSPPSGKDEAGFPLMNDAAFASKLVMPHYAGQGGYFWTGVCICNPNDFPVDISVRPFDGNGAVIDDLVTSMPLEAGAEKTFTVRSEFGEQASTIAYIEFQEEAFGAPIGGFYLYGKEKGDGTPGVEMASGANM
ncbi:MAG: hypothetical protein WA081_02445 [Desulfosalsimonadaceae bacterium]